MRTFHVIDSKHINQLFNAGYRKKGVIKSSVEGQLYQFDKHTAEKFCKQACELEIYFEELT